MTENSQKKGKKDKIDYDQLAIPKVRKGTGGSIDYSQLADPKPTKKKKGKKSEDA